MLLLTGWLGFNYISMKINIEKERKGLEKFRSPLYPKKEISIFGTFYDPIYVGQAIVAI